MFAVTETYEQPLNGNQNIELKEEVGYLQHTKLATQLPVDSIYEGVANLAVCRRYAMLVCVLPSLVLHFES